MHDTKHWISGCTCGGRQLVDSNSCNRHRYSMPRIGDNASGVVNRFKRLRLRIVRVVNRLADELDVAFPLHGHLNLQSHPVRACPSPRSLKHRRANPGKHETLSWHLSWQPLLSMCTDWVRL